MTYLALAVKDRYKDKSSSCPGNVCFDEQQYALFRQDIELVSNIRDEMAQRTTKKNCILYGRHKVDNINEAWYLWKHHILKCGTMIGTWGTPHLEGNVCLYCKLKYNNSGSLDFGQSTSGLNRFMRSQPLHFP